jgi:transposase
LSDEQWEVIAPLLLAAIGRNGRISRRLILNAIFYIHRTGCQWRYLPKEYPHWKSVYSCFWRWQRSGVWDRVMEALRLEMRYSQGRTATPSAAIIDSQSVPTTEKGGPKALTATKRSKVASDSP